MKRTLYHTLQFGDGTNRDVMSAVNMAAHYPFRPGVSRSLVLVTCDQCEDASRWFGRDVSKILTDRGITLHVLRPQVFDVSILDTARTDLLLGNL